jgi:hypothetical protein
MIWLDFPCENPENSTRSPVERHCPMHTVERRLAIKC